MEACLDSDGATLEPFTPRVFRCRASFTTVCFEFAIVDLFVYFNHVRSEGVELEAPAAPQVWSL